MDEKKGRVQRHDFPVLYEEALGGGL